MKKYWKTMFIVVFSIIVLGIFYMNVSSYSENLPHFAFETMEGDEKSLENVQIQGDTNLSMLNFEAFKIGENGTEYFRDEAFLDRLDGYYYSEYIKSLSEEHKSFMRGKEPSPDYFYENENILVYASTSSDFIDSLGQKEKDLTMDVLNKETNERKTTSVPIQDIESFWHVEVLGVQLVDDTIHILTSGMENIDEGVTRYTVYNYAVNVSSGELTSTNRVYSYEDTVDEESYVDMAVLLNEDSNYPIYAVVEYETIYAEYDGKGNMVKSDESKLLSARFYDVTTNEEVAVDVPNAIGLPIALQNDVLFLVEAESGNLHLTSFNITNTTKLNELDVEMENGELSYMELMYEKTIQDGKLYLKTTTENLDELPSIAIVDLTTMETDYRGQIVLENGEETLKMLKGGQMEYQYPVYFSGIELKEN